MVGVGVSARSYAEEFKPERFLPEGAGGANKVTADTYFPGGMGQHQCPGMNLSTLMTQMFLAYMTCTFDSWEPDLEVGRAGGRGKWTGSGGGGEGERERERTGVSQGR